MDANEIIQGEYIKEANVNNILTRNRCKLLNKKKLPIATVSNTLPVIPEKEYTHYRLRLRFFRNENTKPTYKQLFVLLLLYFYIIYFLKNRFCFYINFNKLYFFV
tara:strand:+ start:30 stop:344 length:315 start_codon:yes stop_codon:yes gene_type:complete